jgi:hypothetical protein
LISTTLGRNTKAFGRVAIRLVRRAAIALGVVTAVALLGDLSNADSRPAAPQIVMVPPALPTASFEVRGLTPGVLERLRRLEPAAATWSQIFRVSVENGLAVRLPMVGTYSVRGDAVRFKPRFPLERGLKYLAAFDSAKVSASDNRVRLAGTFVIPEQWQGPPAQLVAVYPSGSELPENLLRIYLSFSAPMSQGGCYQYVMLVRDDGKQVIQPFLELPQELWNPQGTRLTLLFEPGRVKQGLKPREEEGAVLIAGRSYTLTIDSKWPDATGRPLQKGVQKTFRVIEAQRSQLDPQSWTIRTPASGSREPVVVAFPKSLDYAMLGRVLHIMSGGDGAASPLEEVAGDIRLADDETRWIFVPSAPWKPGPYRLVVSTSLEDPAGNSIGRAFEVRRDQSIPEIEPPRSITLRFNIPVAPRH